VQAAKTGGETVRKYKPLAIIGEGNSGYATGQVLLENVFLFAGFNIPENSPAEPATGENPAIVAPGKGLYGIPVALKSLED